MADKPIYNPASGKPLYSAVAGKPIWGGCGADPDCENCFYNTFDFTNYRYDVEIDGFAAAGCSCTALNAIWRLDTLDCGDADCCQEKTLDPALTCDSYSFLRLEFFADRAEFRIEAPNGTHKYVKTNAGFPNRYSCYFTLAEFVYDETTGDELLTCDGSAASVFISSVRIT